MGWLANLALQIILERSKNMDVKETVEGLKKVLNSVLSAENLDEAKKLAKQGVLKAEDFMAEAEAAIDPLLAKWANSKWSLAIAIGFGIVLLAAGDILNVTKLVTVFF